MAKRRRERDRPKVPPDALYNPNKRILLSYESGDEGDDAAPTWTSTTAVPAFEPTMRAVEGNNYVAVDAKATGLSLPEATHGLDSSGEQVDGPAGQSWEGEEEIDEGTTYLPKPASRVGKHVVTGQTPTLGSLAYQWDDGDASEDYGSDEAEAMTYLRSVRLERQRMPTVFYAQRTEQENVSERGVGDTRGFFDDHAYVAQPVCGPDVPPEIRAVDPQEAFAQSLKRRFLSLRDKLHCSPSAEALTMLTSNQSTTFPSGDWAAYATWKHTVVSEAPVLAQIQLLDQQAVLRLLKLIRSRLLRPGKPVTRTVSAWIWSLLARLEDVGTLKNDEVSVVRELGKQAILMTVSLRDPAMAAQLQAVQKESRAQGAQTVDAADEPLPDPGEDDGVRDDDHEDAEATQPSYSESGQAIRDSADLVTSAALDMILVIAGDVFGQRDLLDCRPAWSAVTGT